MPARRKTTVKCWVALGVAAIGASYILSSGPAEWLVQNGKLSDAGVQRVLAFYAPLQWFCRVGPRWMRDAIVVYIETWTE